MAHYIALIHKELDSCYGVSFPDVPGVTTAGDTIDEAIEQAAQVLTFAAEDWTELSGKAFPQPRTIDALRMDAGFVEDAVEAIVVAVPLRSAAQAAA